MSVYSNDKAYVFCNDGLFDANACSSGSASAFVDELNRLNDEVESMREVVEAADDFIGDWIRSFHLANHPKSRALINALKKLKPPKTEAELLAERLAAADELGAAGGCCDYLDLADIYNEARKAHEAAVNAKGDV